MHWYEVALRVHKFKRFLSADFTESRCVEDGPTPDGRLSRKEVTAGVLIAGAGQHTADAGIMGAARGFGHPVDPLSAVRGVLPRQPR